MKKSKTDKNVSFFKEVKNELKHVSWPTRENVLKNTVATIVFILVMVGFFLLINLLFAVILEVIK